MTSSYDVAVIGAGPVGSVAAAAFARRGAKVLLCEAQPLAAERLAGEWIHPPAVATLAALGMGDLLDDGYPSGQGFVVYPDDDSGVITLPYRPGTAGASFEHSALVRKLRARASAERGVEYVEPARVTRIENGSLTYELPGRAPRTVAAGLVVGADGRGSIAGRALHREPRRTTSRMAGMVLDCELPHEGFGHLFLGGPGPALVYRIDARRVRACFDVPLSVSVQRDAAARLWDAFGAVLPRELRRPLRAALERDEVSWASNQYRSRRVFGREGLALVGDAVGCHHPLTAAGITLGLQDAVALAEAPSVDAYARKRSQGGRVPEALAVVLYEVFTQTSHDAVAMRRAVYELWRRWPTERERTMGYLSCDDTSAARFVASFLGVALLAGTGTIGAAVRSGLWRHHAGVGADLVRRCGDLVAALRRPAEGAPKAGGVLVTGDATEPPPQARQPSEPAVQPISALERGVRALRARQQAAGAWEGECVWNSMLPAQYVILTHLTRTPLSAKRRARILLQFSRTRLADGTWGMHERSGSYLVMTTLVYVAARILGVAPEDELCARAKRFIDAEGGAVSIPSWGKLWLALLGTYEWTGVNPVLPELWALPTWLPVHPSNYYCHTRLIYLAMASLYGEDIPSADPALRDALRRELYPQGYDRVDFSRAARELRSGDVFVPPGPVLRAAYDALRGLDRIHAPDRRRAVRRTLLEHIRFELRSTDDTFLSPVNGMLSLLALWRHDPEDPDFVRGLDRLEGWMWEDDVEGTRIAGARSASWDTALAAQALTAASAHVDTATVLEKADDFLRAQQITAVPAADYERFFRIDPRGGTCFAGVWHGWPVSDCTAESLIARLESPTGRMTEPEATAAVEFILRVECPGGGFGSYEPFRPVVGLEWLNPAEMFGDSMTEHPYVECTASCIAALAAFRARFPHVVRYEVDRAIARAASIIRRAQRPDGSWSGNWGVHFTYGTLFGVRGLLASGAAPTDPAVRRACEFLRGHQKPDGGWGERFDSCLEDRWVDHADSQSIQTAWALVTLLEARDPDWDAIQRGAHMLASRQRDDGIWPKEDPPGVFFHTALLHYDLYRLYFPVLALGLYESRRLERLSLVDLRRAPALAPAIHARTTCTSIPS